MEHSLHYQLRACHTNCQKAIITKLRQTGDLRPGEPKILEFLLEHEPCEQKTIAAGCGLDPASVTGILGRMESRAPFFSQYAYSFSSCICPHGAGNLYFSVALFYNTTGIK